MNPFASDIVARPLHRAGLIIPPEQLATVLAFLCCALCMSVSVLALLVLLLGVALTPSIRGIDTTWRKLWRHER